MFGWVAGFASLSILERLYLLNFRGVKAAIIELAGDRTFITRDGQVVKASELLSTGELLPIDALFIPTIINFVLMTLYVCTCIIRRKPLNPYMTHFIVFLNGIEIHLCLFTTGALNSLYGCIGQFSLCPDIF